MILEIVTIYSTKMQDPTNKESIELCVVIKEQCLHKKSSPCPHGRQRSICKECGGSGICIHGKIKRLCKECGGSALCLHNRQKRF